MLLVLSPGQFDSDIQWDIELGYRVTREVSEVSPLTHPLREQGCLVYVGSSFATLAVP